jgi:hypothetical protein
MTVSATRVCRSWPLRCMGIGGATVFTDLLNALARVIEASFQATP